MLAAVTNRARWAVAVSLAAASCARPPLGEAVDGSTARPLDGSVFTAVAPCADDAAYVTAPRTVTFGFLGTPPGFIFCGIHGGLDDGSTMAGVVWVR
jgi:hypothetical protein